MKARITVAFVLLSGMSASSRRASTEIGDWIVASQSAKDAPQDEGIDDSLARRANLTPIGRYQRLIVDEANVKSGERAEAPRTRRG